MGEKEKTKITRIDQGKKGLQGYNPFNLLKVLPYRRIGTDTEGAALNQAQKLIEGLLDQVKSLLDPSNGLLDRGIWLNKGY